MTPHFKIAIFLFMLLAGSFAAANLVTAGLAYWLLYIGSGLLLIVGVVWLLDWMVSKLLDAMWPPSSSEIAQRQAQAIAPRISKDFATRPKAKRSRAWFWWQ